MSEMAELFCYQGFTKNYSTLQIVNNDGTPATGIYTASSVLSASVWLGQNTASIFAPVVAWQTVNPITKATQTGYDQGQFSLSLPAANTLPLDPAGEYFVLVSQTTAGTSSAVWEGRLKVLATPGSTSVTPPNLA